MNISKAELAKKIEHTLLADDIDEKRLLAHCKEALDLQLCGVCVPLAWVPLASKTLEQSDLKIITVIDFPLGKKSTAEKAAEAMHAVSLGADEIDMVLDYHALINKNYAKAFEDLVSVVKAAKNIPVKVIVETSALSREQLVIATTLVALSGAAFIKTSTGFHKSGAQVSDVSLMHDLLPKNIFIKASGGIKSWNQAVALVEAGAQRIGASQSRHILLNSPEDTNACY
jgi:deoxyribose-phosphate aldolase